MTGSRQPRTCSHPIYAHTMDVSKYSITFISDHLHKIPSLCYNSSCFCQLNDDVSRNMQPCYILKSNPTIVLHMYNHICPLPHYLCYIQFHCLVQQSSSKGHPKMWILQLKHLFMVHFNLTWLLLLNSFQGPNHSPRFTNQNKSP